jgi:hypothetical protein
VKRVLYRTARFHSVFGSTDEFGVIKNWVSLGLVRFGSVRLGWVGLGWIGNTVGKICFVFNFILHIAYTVDAFALPGILPSLSLIGTTYCTANTKATQASVQGVGVDS